MYSYAPYPSGSPRSFDRFMDIVFFNKLYGMYLEGTWPLPLPTPRSILNATSSPLPPPTLQHESAEAASVAGTPAQTFSDNQEVLPLSLGSSPTCRSCDDSSAPMKEHLDSQIDRGARGAAAPPTSWRLSEARHEEPTFTDTSKWRRIAQIPFMRQDSLYSTSESPIVGYGPMSPQLVDVERHPEGVNAIDPRNMAFPSVEGGDLAPSSTSKPSVARPGVVPLIKEDDKGFEKTVDSENNCMAGPDCFIRLGVHPDASLSQVAAGYAVQSQRLVTELQDPDSDLARMLELLSELAELKRAFHGAHLVSVRLLATNLQLRRGSAGANADVVQADYRGDLSVSERGSPNTGHETPEARMPLSPCCVSAPRWT